MTHHDRVTNPIIRHNVTYELLNVAYVTASKFLYIISSPGVGLFAVRAKCVYIHICGIRYVAAVVAIDAGWLSS